MIKRDYENDFPQHSKDTEEELEDPVNDPNFNESVIDRLRLQREEV